MEMCTKCSGIKGWLFLIAGLLFLLADFGVFDWGISWWSAAFVIVGLVKVASLYCKDCKA